MPCLRTWKLVSSQFLYKNDNKFYVLSGKMWKPLFKIRFYGNENVEKWNVGESGKTQLDRVCKNRFPGKFSKNSAEKRRKIVSGPSIYAK